MLRNNGVLLLASIYQTILYGTGHANAGLMLKESWLAPSSEQMLNYFVWDWSCNDWLMLKESWRHHLASKCWTIFHGTGLANAGLMLKESWRHHLASKCWTILYGTSPANAILSAILEFVKRFVSNSYRLCLVLFWAIKNEVSISNHFPGSTHTNTHYL